MYSATLRTNDPLRPSFPVTVAALTPLNLTVRPLSLHLYAALGVASREGTVVVATPPGVQIVGASVSEGWLEVRHKRTDQSEAGDKWQVSVQARRTGEAKAQRGFVTIRTTDPDDAEINVPVILSIEHDLRATPAGIVWGSLRSGATYQAEVAIFSRSDTEFAIRSATTDSKAVAVRVEPEPGRPAKRHVLHITLHPTAQGPLETCLVVTTDLLSDSTVRVPVIAYVR